MCLTNPDYYTVWNYRREILGFLMASMGEGEILEAIEGELKITAEGISKKNPKSYCLWHHRLWAVEKGVSNLEEELALTATFLKLDERNFHCWDYRRAICKLAKVLPEEELAFTTDKIMDNFSNYRYDIPFQFFFHV
jgi:geranylgeranyl transferase type-2 subunit alpha